MNTVEHTNSNNEELTQNYYQPNFMNYPTYPMYPCQYNSPMFYNDLMRNDQNIADDSVDDFTQVGYRQRRPRPRRRPRRRRRAPFFSPFIFIRPFPYYQRPFYPPYIYPYGGYDYDYDYDDDYDDDWDD